MKGFKYVLGQPCCICIKENDFDLKGSETDVDGIYNHSYYMSSLIDFSSF